MYGNGLKVLSNILHIMYVNKVLCSLLISEKHDLMKYTVTHIGHPVGSSGNLHFCENIIKDCPT